VGGSTSHSALTRVLCFTPAPAVSCAARSSKYTWKRRVGEGDSECGGQTLLPHPTSVIGSTSALVGEVLTLSAW
jgi:hypothetical protein